MNRSLSWEVTDKPVTSFENGFIEVRTYEVTTPGGGPGTYGVVETRNQAVTIVAMDQDGRVALIDEERFPVAKDHGPKAASLRLPMGSVSAKKGDKSPLDAAIRELREEAGLKAGAWNDIAGCAPMSGLSSEVARVFVARELQLVEEAVPDGDEAIKRGVLWIPLASAVDAMMRHDEVADGQSVAGVALALGWLGTAEAGVRK